MVTGTKLNLQAHSPPAFSYGERRTVPSPLVGEGQGGGDSRTFDVGVAPTPIPSPQGGVEPVGGCGWATGFFHRLGAEDHQRPATPDARCPAPARLAAVLLAPLLVLWASVATAQEPKILNANPDWPCIQHKVATLTAAQMWDGPPVEGLEGWRDMPEVEKLIPTLTSRRVPLEQATAAIEAFAAAQPKDKRDEALKQLFAALLVNVNVDRSVVISGIERFQKRQRSRAKEIEREGEAIRKLWEQAAGDEKARAEIAAAEEKYNWDVRIFTERQQSLPLACEIPTLIEQRLFALAREIRARMQD